LAEPKIIVTFEVATIAQVRKLDEAWREITSATASVGAEPVVPALYLDAVQAQAFAWLANQIGRARSELLREAIDDLLDKYGGDADGEVMTSRCPSAC
jgi:Ribbon-helix-helix domain